MGDSTQASRRVRFGVFEGDLASGELRKNGLKIRLQDQPFQILSILIGRAGDVVTRDELRTRLWPADTFVDFDHGLNTAINKLREALGDSAGSPRFIETLARRGYRFIAPVEWVSASVASNTPRIDAAPAVGVEHELPAIPRGLGRALFALIQLMYLIFYLLALFHLDTVDRRVGRFLGGSWVALVLVTAVIGIAVRLWLLAAVVLDYRGLEVKFRRLFGFTLPLDELWALSPFLIATQVGFGPAYAATAALLLVPFAQRTLLRMCYAGVTGA